MVGEQRNTIAPSVNTLAVLRTVTTPQLPEKSGGCFAKTIGRYDMREQFFTKRGKILLVVCLLSVFLIGTYNLIDEGRGRCWFVQESYETIITAIELKNRELSYASRKQDKQKIDIAVGRFNEKLAPWTGEDSIGGRTELDEMQARAKCRRDSWL